MSGARRGRAKVTGWYVNPGQFISGQVVLGQIVIEFFLEL